MNNYQTMEEIEKEYNGNFVCIINCKRGEYNDIIGGEVIAVSKTKKEILELSAKTPKSYQQYFGDFAEFLGVTNGGLLF